MIFISSDDDLELERKVLLDYDIEIKRLRKENRIYFWEGTGTNYSLDGFEMVFMRHKLQYIIQYYITSGLLVVVSWVSRNEISETGEKGGENLKMRYQHQVVAAFLLI